MPVRRPGTGEVIGAVRVTQSVKAVNDATWRATVGLIAIGALVLVLGLGLGAVIAGQVAGPVRRLDQAARRVAEGDLSARAKVEGSAEQQRLARTFNDMTSRLERLLASQREFVADASHQLRTPLSGLRLRLEEARASTGDTDAHEEIDAGLRELDRLSAMVSELLVLSQAGEVDAPPEQVDLVRRGAPCRGALGRRRGRPRALVRRSRRRPRAARRPRPHARRADRERAPLRQRRGRGAGTAGRDRGARPRAGPVRATTSPRCSSASTAAPPAARGRTAPASGCRSRASSRAAGAERSRSPTATAAARGDGHDPTLSRRLTVAELRWIACLGRHLLWILLAVGGVLLVAGVTLAASRLSTQTIGLSSEPLSAGDELAPRATPTPTASATADPVRSERRARRRARARARATPTPTPPPPVATVDDDGDDDSSGESESGGDDDSGHGRGRDRGRGRGGDDDD